MEVSDALIDEITFNTTHEFILKTDVRRKQLEHIKTLYKGYYCTCQDTDVFAEEFYYAIGELLNGKQLNQLDLKHLNLKELLEE